MRSSQEKPSGTIFPGLIILFAMAAMVVALITIRQPHPSVRVWVPVNSGETSPGDDTSKAICSPVWSACSPTPPDLTSSIKAVSQ
jgi:hypothetical protein